MNIIVKVVVLDILRVVDLVEDLVFIYIVVVLVMLVLVVVVLVIVRVVEEVTVVIGSLVEMVMGILEFVVNC